MPRKKPEFLNRNVKPRVLWRKCHLLRRLEMKAKGDLALNNRVWFRDKKSVVSCGRITQISKVFLTGQLEPVH